MPAIPAFPNTFYGNVSGGAIEGDASLLSNVFSTFDVGSEEYGGKFDGTTVDTPAWLAAITAAYNAGGGLVIARAGKTVVNGLVVPMQFCSNRAIWIVGAGMGVTTLIGTTSGTGAILMFQGNGGVRDLTIDGQGVADQCLWSGSAQAGGIPATNTTGALSVGATSIPITAGTGTAYVADAYAIIDLGLMSQERIYITAVTANTLTVSPLKFAHLSGAQIQQPVVNYQYYQRVQCQNVGQTVPPAEYVWGWTGSANVSRVDCWYGSITDCDASLGNGGQDLVGVSNVLFLHTKGNHWHDSPRNGFNSFSNYLWQSSNDIISNCGFPGAGAPSSLVIDAPNGWAYLDNFKVDSGSGYALIEGIFTELHNCHIDTEVVLCAADYVGHAILTGGVEYIWPNNTLTAKLKIIGGSVGYVLNDGLPGVGVGYTPGNGCSGIIEAHGTRLMPGNPIAPGSGQAAACIQNIQTATSNTPTFDQHIYEGCTFDSTNCSSGALIGFSNPGNITRTQMRGNRAVGPNAVTPFSANITTDPGSGSPTLVNQFVLNSWQPVGIPQPTVGASPWTYLNTSGYEEGFYIGGGTVTGMTYETPNIGGGVGLPITSGLVKISPGSSIVVAYTGLPTVRVLDLMA